MTTSEQQDIRYWLAPAGCNATDGHRPDLDQRHCRVCGTELEVAS